MTERVVLGLKSQIDELMKGGLANPYKSFGLNIFMIQVNQAQIAGIFKPEEGLTPDEAENLRKHILDSADKLKA